MTSEQMWFLKDHGKEQGPFSLSQLKQLAEAGRITPQSIVRRESMGRIWMSAAKVEGLFAASSDPKEVFTEGSVYPTNAADIGGRNIWQPTGMTAQPGNSVEPPANEKPRPLQMRPVPQVRVEPVESPRWPALKKCPYCSEEIMADAIKCKHCGEMLMSQTGSGSFLRVLGLLVFLVGLFALISYYNTFDTTVSVPTQEFFGQQIGGGRVHNVGLMAEKQGGIIIRSLFVALGFVCFLVGEYMGRKH